MVNPPVSPEQDAANTLNDLARLPAWSGKLLKKLIPAPRTRLVMPEIPGEFIVVEAMTEFSRMCEVSEMADKIVELAESSGKLVLVYTRTRALAVALPEEILTMGWTMRDSHDLWMVQDHAVWFTALKASRIYTTTDNNLFSVHFGLAGIPREFILNT